MEGDVRDLLRRKAPGADGGSFYYADNAPRQLCCAAQVACGLVFLHRTMQMLHRDVKPGNILFLSGSAGAEVVVYKLADFGIARAATGTQSWGSC